jgi:large subunit ribosomal protein L17
MFRNMVTSLFKYERIQTTGPKAKELRRWADHIITLAKRGDLHARRQALAIMREKDVVHKLFENAAERFGAVSGGYTRIVKLGRRPGDAAPISMVELIVPQETKKKKTKKKKAKTETAASPKVDKKEEGKPKKTTKPKAAPEAKEEKAAVKAKAADKEEAAKDEKPAAKAPAKKKAKADVAQDAEKKKTAEAQKEAKATSKTKAAAEKQDTADTKEKKSTKKDEEK